MKRRHKAVMQPSASINVTSLLDITFVLLISFMIVAPALKSGIELELPEVSEAPAIDDNKPVEIAVKPGVMGTDIYLNGQVVYLDGLVEEVRSISPAKSGVSVTLEGDKRVNWQNMAEIIATLRAGGITEIGIVTTVRDT